VRESKLNTLVHRFRSPGLSWPREESPGKEYLEKHGGKGLQRVNHEVQRRGLIGFSFSMAVRQVGRTDLGQR
jgi:hypothetical protein